MPARRRAAPQASSKTETPARRGPRTRPKPAPVTIGDGGQQIDQNLGYVHGAAEHPGVLAAHAGQVTAEECDHPAGRRDGKNPGFCRACGTGGHPAPPAAQQRR